MPTQKNQATKPAADAGEPDGHRPTIDSAAIDRLNLAQALRDFEVANVRVVDLTARLTAMHEQMLDLQHRCSLAELHLASAVAMQSQLEFERDAARDEVAQLRASRSYRIGNMVVRLVKTVSP